MEKLNLRQLRRQRRKQYWLGVAPYFRYMGNYLLGFVLIIIVGFYGYGYFVRHLPDPFPVFPLMSVLLAITVNSGSFRTYLRDADVVFLLRVESRISMYLNPCLRSAYVLQVVMITLLWSILWPLSQAMHEQSILVFAVVWLQLALMQGVVIVGRWQENRIQESRTRQTFIWIRTVTSGLFIYVVLTQHVAWSLLSITAASIVYLLALHATAQYTVHWERLIALELKSRSRWITWFNLFTEVPREHSPVRQTRWLHRMANLLAFKKANAYRYLYVLTWIRSDLFAVVVRLTILGALLIIMISGVWIKLGLLVLFAYVTKLQLSELERYHKNTETSSVYPVLHDQRANSARFIARRIHIAVLVVLLGAFLFDILT